MGFKTHTEGGSWTGGGTQVVNCNTTEVAAIRTALRFLVSTGQPSVAAIAGLGSLASCLTTKNESSIVLDCRGSSCRPGVFGTTNARGGNEVNFCPPALPPGGLQVDTDVTLFHEFIHTCDGMELDAWALENHCYAGHGTINPGPSNVTGFMGETADIGSGLRASRFLVWEPATGRVFVKVETGGSWNSSPTISRGVELSVNNPSYIFRSGGSSGGNWI